MKKARKRKMLIAVGILLALVSALMIWFNISYSPIKKQFQNDVASLVCIRRSPAAAGAVVNGSSAVTAAAV